MGIGGEDGLVDLPQAHGGLVGLFALAFFHPALRDGGQVAGPGRERIIHLAGGAIGRIEHSWPDRAARRQARATDCDVGQTLEIDAEGGHQRGVMRGEEARVGAEVQVAGRQMLGVVVGGVGGGAVGIFDQRPLQLVGNDAQLVAAHVQQRIDAGLDADAIGRGNELAVGDEAQLVGVGNDPLRVGGGEVGAEPEDARAEVGGVVQSGVRCPRG